MKNIDVIEYGGKNNPTIITLIKFQYRLFFNENINVFKIVIEILAFMEQHLLFLFLLKIQINFVNQ